MLDIDPNFRLLIVGLVIFIAMTWLLGMRIAVLVACTLVVVVTATFYGVDVIGITRDLIRSVT